jgi:signal transduction histidine kinase
MPEPQRVWESRFDLALAVGISGLTLHDVVVQTGVAPIARVTVGVTMTVATGSLLLRRRLPLVPCVLIAAALATQAAVSGVDFSSSGTAIAVFVALYSAGAYLETARMTAAVGVLAIGLGARELRDLDAWRRDPGNEAFWWLLVLSTAGVGVIVRHRRRAARLHALQEESDRQARLAAREERERIARELHDVVAHGVSAVVVQAEAAEELLDRSPDHARESLWMIQRLSREALAEMRQVLGILRGPTEDSDRAPQPTLADLPALIERNREAGLTVRLDVVGEARSLPPATEVSAYRVVQEALTNVRKHAGRARATVSVRYRPEALGIEVVNDGAAAGAARAVGGHGLIGMRERVTFFGGEFAAGPLPGGGFALTATFPTAVAVPR